MSTISRRKFLQISGLAAGASMLPMPMKWLGSGKAEAFYQSPNIPLYGTTLRLGEIPVALPNPLGAGAVGPAAKSGITANIGAEWARNESASVDINGTQVAFPWSFPKSGIVGDGVNLPFQTGAPVTGVRHYSLTLQQFVDPGVAPTLGGTTLWGYKPDLTLLEGLTALGAVKPGNPFYTNPAVNPQPARQLGGIIISEAGPNGKALQLTMRNNLPATAIIPNDLTIPGTELGQDRTTVHFHGGLMPWISDGGPFDWFSSAQRLEINRVSGSSFINNSQLNPGVVGTNSENTQGEFYWAADKQFSRFVWYHDHAFGITRTNAYAGVATGHIYRDDFERYLVTQGLPKTLETSLLDGIINLSNPAPFNAPTNGDWPVREYPLVFQDKVFVGADIKLKDPSWNGVKTPGSLWYPHVYEATRWRRMSNSLTNPVKTLPQQSVIAEMFGDTMLVNGTASPSLAVEPRRYRFRLLNACNARFLNLQLYIHNGTATGITLDPVTGYPTNTPFTNKATGAASWFVMGNECGFLRNTTAIASNKPLNGADFPFTNPASTSLLLGSAFRPDVIVDFGNYPVGTKVVLYNDCPAPFPGGDPRNDYFPGYSNGNTVNKNGTAAGVARNTRCIMQFVVSKGTSNMNPDNLLKITVGQNLQTTASGAGKVWSDTPLITQQSEAAPVTYNIVGTPLNWTSIDGVTINKFKNLSLNEVFDDFGRLEQRLGPLSAAPTGLLYLDAPGPEELINNLDTEVWAIYNTTADVHPMHFHMSNWQVVGRQAYAGIAPNLAPTGLLRGCRAEEIGWKETVLCWPGEIVYIMAKWDIPQIAGPALTGPANTPTGPHDPAVSPRFNDAAHGFMQVHETVWHCHILEHEEHDMMRPLLITITRP